MTEQQLQDLLHTMTLRQKIGQMFQGSGRMIGNESAVTGWYRLRDFNQEDMSNMGSILNAFGKDVLADVQRRHLEHNPIPLLFMADIIYGYKEIFPISLGMASTFDPDLVQEFAHISASEAAADGINVTFSPMVDIARDARWGRCAEGYGEDTLLSSRCAEAMVKGYQGDDLSAKDTLMACVKHFAAYGAPYDGKDYNAVDLSQRSLEEIYLPPYRAAVKAGARMVMSSFNTLNGIPASVNRWLLKDLLRDKWGFRHVIISDYAAIAGVMKDGGANDRAQLCKMSVDATLDIDMMDNVYLREMEGLLERGELTIEQIDEGVLRILRCKNELGILDDPFRYLNPDDPDPNNYEAHHEFAKKAVCEASVLLKNDGILPLSDAQTVAVIGPYAFCDDLISNWSNFLHSRRHSLTIAQCVEELAKERFVGAAEGCPMMAFDEPTDEADRQSPIYGHEEEYLQKAVELARQADVVIMPLGEHISQFGESRSRADITLSPIQMKLFRAVHAVNPNIIVVLFQGRPLAIPELDENAKAVLNVWFPGSAGGEAIGDMLFGRRAPSGKLPMGMPQRVGQVPMCYRHLNTNHPNETGSRHSFLLRYIDTQDTPLYPFGFGLTYTTFEVSQPRLSATEMTQTDTITVTVDVTNTGMRDGQTVIQLYLRDLLASFVSRPTKELKDFRRVFVPAGQTKTVTFPITEEMLRFYNAFGQWDSEVGEFHAMVGTSSADADLKTASFFLR